MVAVNAWARRSIGGMTTNILPDWLIQLQTSLPNETAGAHLARALQAFNGVSLVHNTSMLTALFEVNELTPTTAQQMSTVQTNCGTVSRCLYSLCGSTNSYLNTPYKIGTAVSYVLQAAIDTGSIIDCIANPNAWQQLDVGYLMHYCGAPGTDHLEWCLSKPDAITGAATSGGGGRSENAITCGHNPNVRVSNGRPLRHIIRPDILVPAGPSIPISPPVIVQVPVVVQPPSPTPPPVIVSPSPAAPPTTLESIIALVVALVKRLLSIR